MSSMLRRNIMSKRTIALLGTVFALAVGAAPATAASVNHAEPGTPETNNCSGQSTAYIAQIGSEFGVHGVGGVAKAFNVSVQEFQELIGYYCANG
jgi:hypothetical protein